MNYKQIYNRLLIFDGSFCLHRVMNTSYWNMLTSTGIRTGGVFGVLRTILKEVSNYNYYPIVVFDGGLSSRRLELFPNYKHTEDKKEKQLLLENLETKSEEDLLDEEIKREYATQREILKQLLPYFNIPVISYEGWEGDDLIYILSKISNDSIVISDDKDLLQLIREDSSGRCRVKRAMLDEFWDINKLQESYKDVIYYIAEKAIVGDQSDNIPSACYGVGAKTASSLYDFYKFVKENNINYPTTEEDLIEICKKHNLTKKKAFINFDEYQFMVNLMLTDLKLVDEDLIRNDLRMLYIIRDKIDFFFKNQFDENLQKQNIVTILDYLEIKSFDFNQLFNLIKQVKDVIYNIETNLDENRKIHKGLLF